VQERRTQKLKESGRESQPTMGLGIVGYLLSVPLGKVDNTATD
jgi:hypothetical protein